MRSHKPKSGRPSFPPKPRPQLRLEPMRPVYFFTPDLEREIARLDGITAVRVLSTGSEIDEIHILAPRSSTPKKLVRDVESLLLVRFGIRIDHRKISVVRTEYVSASDTSFGRPQIRQVQREGDLIQVQIGADHQTITGAHPLREKESELEGASRALINAVEQLLNTPGLLALDHAQCIPMREQTIVLILLRWTFSGQQERLVGASIAYDDLPTTAARATLDAINRKIVRLQTTDTEPD